MQPNNASWSSLLLPCVEAWTIEGEWPLPPAKWKTTIKFPKRWICSWREEQGRRRDRGYIQSWRCRWKGHALVWNMNRSEWNGEVKCGWPVFDLHEVENIATAGDEEQFHDRVVHGYVVVKKVEISCNEDTNVEGLCFKGYTCFKNPNKSTEVPETGIAHGKLTSTWPCCLDFMQ